MAFNLLLALTILWNLVVLLAGALFIFFAYVIPDDFVCRRYPGLTLLQLLCLSTWTNLMLQRSGWSLEYDPVEFLRNPWVFAVGVPISGIVNVGWSLQTDLFAMRKLRYESQTKKEFDWKQHLNRLERVFFRVQAWFLRTDTIMGYRRYPQRAMLLGILAAFLITIIIVIPGGLLWGDCFNPSIGIEACITPPQYGMYFGPTILFYSGYACTVPVLIFMLRTLNDPLYMREELVFNYILLMIVYITSITITYLDWPKIPDPLGAFYVVILGVPWTLLTMYFVPILFCIRNLLEARRKAQNVEHNQESFQRILKDKHMFEELKKVMTANFALENALFWEDLMTLERANATSKAQDVKSDSFDALLQLYVDYIPAGSPRELNLLSATRQKVVADFRAGALTVQSFAMVRKEVADMMYLNSFPQLVRTIQARRQSGSMAQGNSLLRRAITSTGTRSAERPSDYS